MAHTTSIQWKDICTPWLVFHHLQWSLWRSWSASPMTHCRHECFGPDRQWECDAGRDPPEKDITWKNKDSCGSSSLSMAVSVWNKHVYHFHLSYPSINLSDLLKHYSVIVMHNVTTLNNDTDLHVIQCCFPSNVVASRKPKLVLGILKYQNKKRRYYTFS